MRLLLPLALAALEGCAGWTQADTIAALISGCGGFGYGVGEVTAERVADKLDAIKFPLGVVDAGPDAGADGARVDGGTVDAGSIDAGDVPAAVSVAPSAVAEAQE